MAQPMRFDRDDERRRREVAMARDYEARAANDPVLKQRLAEWQAELASGEIDEANLIPYEDLMARIRERSTRV